MLIVDNFLFDAIADEIKSACSYVSKCWLERANKFLKLFTISFIESCCNFGQTLAEGQCLKSMEHIKVQILIAMESLNSWNGVHRFFEIKVLYEILGARTTAFDITHWMRLLAQVLHLMIEYKINKPKF